MSLRGAELRALAKINPYLEVLGKRNDGFHELELIFQRISLCDIIHLQEQRAQTGTTISYEQEDYDFGSGDICFRAAEAIRALVPAMPGIEIRIKKNIPIGGGLGGASSGAAVILKQLATWYELDQKLLPDIALELGSDVPFFLSDYACAYARGRGELLQAIEPMQQNGCYLLTLPAGLETAAVFKELRSDERGPRAAHALSDWNPAATDGLVNRLTDSSRRLLPCLDALLDTAAQRGIPVFMSGSGSTCFSFDQRAQDLAGVDVQWVAFPRALGV